MMGRVKFILPNALGVYLHDTPLRGFFNLNQRLASAGCVRLEDATALGRWIFGEDLSQSDSTSPERRVNLIPPVPVYLTYLTAAPTASGVSYLPDIYHRDTALKAAMAKAGRG
jgi:murein L,D-transpeptidase YcbB/YkuD